MGVQVRTAAFNLTKDEAGNPIWVSRPVMERQFISFSWGGKNIEDFDLLVITVNNRINKGLYSNFTDITKSYTYIDGQSYWGTTIQANQIDLTLSTDGMDSRTMEQFKAYFKPGESKRLILSEYPFRYAMARVSKPPQMSMLPFEKKMDGFRTTEYKGDISLSFIMDDPFWYNVEDANCFQGKLSEEQKKDVYETGTPVVPMEKPAWIAGKVYNNSDALFSPSNAFVYYCGTAPTRPKLIAKTSYKDIIKNDVNTIKISSMENNDIESVMSFTLPPALADIKHIQEMLSSTNTEITNATSLVDFKQMLREQTICPSVRKAVIKALDGYNYITVNNKDTVLKRIISNNTALNIFTQADYILLVFDGQSGSISVQYVIGNNATFTEQAGLMLKSEFLKIDAQGYNQLSANFNCTLQLDYRYTFY